MGRAAIRCWLAGATLAALVAATHAGAALSWPSPLFVPKPTPTPSSASADPRPEKPLYAFDYSVNSPFTGDMKSQWETRDGDVVRGSYTVVQPDGSVLTVEYTADGRNGFKAVVKKDGVFVQPTESPNGFDQVPLYLALKPLLRGLPAPPTTAAPTTTTTAAPPSGGDGKRGWFFDDIYEKFWKTYGTSLYGRNRPLFDFFGKGEEEKPTEKPKFPFYFHLHPEEPKYYYKSDEPYPVYYYVNTKKSEVNPTPTYPYYYYIDTTVTENSTPRPVNPFYYYFGNLDSKFDKDDLTDTIYSKI